MPEFSHVTEKNQHIGWFLLFGKKFWLFGNKFIGACIILHRIWYGFIFIFGRMKCNVYAKNFPTSTRPQWRLWIGFFRSWIRENDFVRHSWKDKISFVKNLFMNLWTPIHSWLRVHKIVKPAIPPSFANSWKPKIWFVNSWIEAPWRGHLNPINVPTTWQKWSTGP